MATVQQAPSFQTPVVSCSQLKGNLPNATIEEGIDCIGIATSCIARLESLQENDFTSDALWRDSLSITGHQRTFDGASTIFAAWNELVPRCKPHNFRLVPQTAQVFKLGPKPAWLTAIFQFETEGEHAAECSGMLNMVPDESGAYKIWLMATIMEFLKDDKAQGNPDSIPDPTFAPAANLGDGADIDCVVVGGGMAGLCVAGRLHAMRVPYVVLERNAAVGDNWTKRYDSLHIHLSNTYSEMPFRRVYEGKPYHLSSQDLAEGMQRFVNMHNIQVWLSSALSQARWDEQSRTWNVKIQKQGNTATLKAKHLIMAIGGGLDKPNYPEYANRDSFQGTVMHSVEWKNAEAFAGKEAIIIGSANSALDIAQDLVNSNASSITLVQRSVTHVMSGSVLKPLQDGLYNPETDVGLADRLVLSPPYAAGRLMVMAGADALQAQDAHRYDFLKEAGFRFHQSPDLFSKPLERFGGHLLDHGALQIIKNGKVKQKHPPNPFDHRWLEHKK